MAKARPGEGAAFIAALLIVFLVAYELGYKGLVLPTQERVRRTRADIAQVRTQKQWVRKLRARVTQLEKKMKAVAPRSADLQAHLVRDDNDRFRMAVARDQAARDLSEFTITPIDSGVPPVRSNYRIPVDPNEQLVRLKQTFLKQNPRAVFGKWAVPGTIDVLRYADRMAVEAPFPDLMRFIARLEADHLLIQVTELKVGSGRDGRASATLEITGIGLPGDESTAGAQ